MNTLHCLKVARQFTLIREVFYDKGLGSQNNKLLITAFVYNYVILKHSVLFVLDLKQMAICTFSITCMEITGMLMIGEF